jgi:hypothetical protein
MTTVAKSSHCALSILAPLLEELDAAAADEEEEAEAAALAVGKLTENVLQKNGFTYQRPFQPWQPPLPT